jgi:hypothetical protein
MSSLQDGPKFDQAVSASACRRIFRYAANAGDIFKAQILEISQDDDFPLFHRKAFKGFGKPADLGRIRPFDGFDEAGKGALLEAKDIPCSSPRQEPQGFVLSDFKGKGVQTADKFQTDSGPRQPDKDFLEDILGVAGGAESINEIVIEAFSKTVVKVFQPVVHWFSTIIDPPGLLFRLTGSGDPFS